MRILHAFFLLAMQLTFCHSHLHAHQLCCPVTGSPTMPACNAIGQSRYLLRCNNWSLPCYQSSSLPSPWLCFCREELAAVRDFMHELDLVRVWPPLDRSKFSRESIAAFPDVPPKELLPLLKMLLRTEVERLQVCCLPQDSSNVIVWNTDCATHQNPPRFNSD